MGKRRGGEREREGKGREVRGREGQEKRPVFWFCVVGNPKYTTLVNCVQSWQGSTIKQQRLWVLLPTAVNKKAQLTLSNPRDVKACQNCSNSTCFVSFHRIPFPQIANA